LLLTQVTVPPTFTVTGFGESAVVVRLAAPGTIDPVVPDGGGVGDGIGLSDGIGMSWCRHT
jgi:hypothetical protein